MNNTNVSINAEQRLFVLPAGSGFTCMGFDVVEKKLLDYCKKLGRDLPCNLKAGTLEQFEHYQEVQRDFIATRPNETQFDPETDPRVVAILESYRETGKKIRLFFGDPGTGQEWFDENDVYGTIGRSIGPLKVPLLCASGSRGGPQILTACIVKMVDGKSKDGIYRHPGYIQPDFIIQENEHPDYAASVSVNGKVQARFTTLAKAQRWKEFMLGKRMNR